MRKNMCIILFIICLTLTITVHSEDSRTSSDSGLTITTLTDPKILTTYQPYTWSNKGYIELANHHIPEDGTIEWVKLESAKIMATCGQYREIYLYLWDEEGNSTRLKYEELNTEFAGKVANQKFYLTFYTNYMEFKGNSLMVTRPKLIFSIKNSLN